MKQESSTTMGLRAFRPFSPKQKRAMLWWKLPDSRLYDAIICDGAVRSGKTLSMSIGFILWAMKQFDGYSFALCGKTIASLRRNVTASLTVQLQEMGLYVQEKVSANLLTVFSTNRKNFFYLFGGKDEGSASLIQGMTLAGVFLDEAALMPRSFVEQALARCSVPGSRLWFNCNPGNPGHWFYREWIVKSAHKNALYLHFTMDDNPSLSPAIKKRYQRMYSGAFYDRYILGKWTAEAGLVYSMFSQKRHVYASEDFPGEYSCGRYVISCDYGTVNPASFGLWGRDAEGRWRRLREYYYDSRKTGRLRTDEEHYAELEALAGNLAIETVVCDPSAASFLETIRRHERFSVIPAKNEVLNGIRRVSSLLAQDMLLFSSSCNGILQEFTLYCWEENGITDTPRKEHDHAMDDMRYFVSTILRPELDGNDFFVSSVGRN